MANNVNANEHTNVTSRVYIREASEGKDAAV